MNRLSFFEKDGKIVSPISLGEWTGENGVKVTLYPAVLRQDEETLDWQLGHVAITVDVPAKTVGVWDGHGTLLWRSPVLKDADLEKAARLMKPWLRVAAVDLAPTPIGVGLAEYRLWPAIWPCGDTGFVLIRRESDDDMTHCLYLWDGENGNYHVNLWWRDENPELHQRLIDLAWAKVRNVIEADYADVG